MAVGDAPVAKEERDLVGGLWTKSDEVPEHVGILFEERGGGNNMPVIFLEGGEPRDFPFISCFFPLLSEFLE